MIINEEMVTRAFDDAESVGGWGDDATVAWLRALAYLILYYIKARGFHL